EDLAGLHRALKDLVDQVRQMPTNRGRATVQMHVAEEQICAAQLDTMRHTHVADVSAGTGRVDRLMHRLVAADALEHAIGTDTLGQLLDASDAFITTF